MFFSFLFSGLLGVHGGCGHFSRSWETICKKRNVVSAWIWNTIGQILTSQRTTSKCFQVCKSKWLLHLQNSFCLHILASHYFFCRLYNPMRIKDLTALDPNTPWLEYINKILSPDIIQVCRNITLCKIFIILITFL